MNRIVRLYFIVFFCVVDPEFVLAQTNVAEPRSPLVTVRILHTNDIHGHILPEFELKAGVTPPPLFGGAASLATALRKFRSGTVFGKPADVSLYVDAGDFFQGTPEGTLTRGDAMIQMFKMVRLDAQACGNHDLDLGPENFARLAKNASWPILGLNMIPENGDGGLSKPVVLQNSQTGLRIALIGWITDDIVSVTTVAARQGLSFRKSIETARMAVAALPPDVDLVIAITHAGVAQDTQVADQVGGIHIIVGGHSHTALSPYYKSDTTGTVVVQAGSYLRDLGVLDVLFNRQTRKIIRSNSQLIPLLASEFPPDRRVRRWAGRVSRQVGRLLDEQISQSDSDYLRSSDTECVPGNLLADAMRWHTSADAAFQNSFGIRADLPKGSITLRTLFTIMPFDNTVTVMTLTGIQILDLLEQSASKYRGFLQMSGVRMTVDLSRPIGERVLEARIAGKNISPRKTYRVATNSFLAEGGDYFDTFAKGTDRQDNGQNMRDVVRDYLKERTAADGTYRGAIDGRLILRQPVNHRSP